jgi:hypothetical protein
MRGFILITNADSMPCFLLDTLLFALTLYRVLSDRRQANKTPLLRLVLRDGAWAYLLIFGERVAGLDTTSLTS